MEHVPVDDLRPEVLEPGVERHQLSGALETTGMALNRYRIASGEGLPGGLHAHADQEEVFVVLEGEARFEVLEPRNETRRANDEPAVDEIVVAEGEAVRFAPGEFQSGQNGSTDDLVALALGAPRDSEDVRLPVGCPECGNGEMCMDTEGGVELVCPDCGTARIPAPCPGCDGEDLRVTLDRGATEKSGGRDGTVVVCSDCSATFETPPFRD